MQKLNKQQLPSDVVADLSYNMTDSSLIATKADGTQVEIMKTTSEEKFQETTSAIVASIGSPKSDNGDIPIIELVRTGEQIYQLREDANHIQPTNLAANTGTFDYSTWTFDENKVRGYLFSAQAPFYRGKIINRVKLEIAYPGLVRIGIVNNHVLDVEATYDKCLVKWLVVKFCAYTGLKEFDIEDTIVGDDEWIFIECKSGETGNCQIPSDSTVKIGSKSYTNITTNGAAPASAYDTMKNGEVFKSNNLKTASARPFYTSRQRAKSSALPSDWNDIGKEITEPMTPDMGYNAGDLNIGLYVKGPASDTHPFPLSENALSASVNGVDSDVARWYFQIDQSSLINQKVYAVKLDIHTPGTLSVARIRIPNLKEKLNSLAVDGAEKLTETDLDGAEILEIYTHYFRSIGLNQWNLPKDLMIEDENEILVLNGYHSATPADSDLVQATAKFCYSSDTSGNIDLVENDSCKYNDNMRSTRFVSLLQDKVTRKFIEAGASNLGACLNVDWVIRGECNSKLEGTLFSVTGDSISTYRGEVNTIDDGNTTNNSIYYPNNGAGQVNNREVTWWGILARDKRLRLLRNDAWSGSKVSEGTNNANTEAAACSTARTQRLKYAQDITVDSRCDSGIPQLILSCIGTNDLSSNVTLGTMSRTSTTTTNTILGAFSAMCYRLKTQHAGTKIVHFLLPRGNTYTYVNSNSVYLPQLAEEFEKIAKSWGQYFIPMSYFHKLCPTNQYMYKSNGIISPVNQVSSNVDYLHPSANGMEAVAQAIGEYLETIY